MRNRAITTKIIMLGLSVVGCGAPAPADPGAAQAQGHLPKEVIQRVMRENFARFGQCYENGLRNNPALKGTVIMRVVISGADGSVSDVSDAGSDMPDAEVVSCVKRAFQGVIFPTPEGGPVIVNYPFMFAPHP